MSRHRRNASVSRRPRLRAPIGRSPWRLATPAALETPDPPAANCPSRPHRQPGVPFGNARPGRSPPRLRHERRRPSLYIGERIDRSPGCTDCMRGLTAAGSWGATEIAGRPATGATFHLDGRHRAEALERQRAVNAANTRTRTTRCRCRRRTATNDCTCATVFCNCCAGRSGDEAGTGSIFANAVVWPRMT